MTYQPSSPTGRDSDKGTTEPGSLHTNGESAGSVWDCNTGVQANSKVMGGVSDGMHEQRERAPLAEM